MTSSSSAPINKTWPLPADSLVANESTFEALTAAEADAMPVELGARAPLAGLAMLRDSLNILSAFGWGKTARLSKTKSAEMCDLMNGWN